MELIELLRYDLTMIDQKDLSVQGHLERNMVQLALMLTVQQVDADRTTFSREIKSDTPFHETRLQCTALAGHVVPHGSDNDIYAALTSLYVEQGMPESGIIIATAYRIVTLAGLTDGSNSYRALAQSLNRMRNAAYKIEESWHDQVSGTTMDQEFNLLAAVTRVNRSTVPQEFRVVRSETLLRIQLPDPIAHSIRNGYIRTYDIELYQNLKNVLGRGLYRVLDTMRSADQVSLTLPLIAWGEYLGYESPTASKMKSRLELAHTELIRTGYLRDALYGGRGSKMYVTYVFNTQILPAPRTDTVAQLTQRGFTLERARVLAVQYGSDLINDAARRFDYIKEQGISIQNPPAIMTTILKNPEQYPLPSKKQEPRKINSKKVLPNVKTTIDSLELGSAEPPMNGEGMVRSVLSSLVARKKIGAAEEALVISLHAQGRVTPIEVTGLVAHPQPIEVIGRWVIHLPG
ncbi:replication initiator protein A [Deinococcus oregonensis]|uniref:Replication initiator protein A n=1 Tax=Deinococcus oregonensis TaxID=1805970 RepID=A0ABV6AW47_9DEIO